MFALRAVEDSEVGSGQHELGIVEFHSPGRDGRKLKLIKVEVFVSCANDVANALCKAFQGMLCLFGLEAFKLLLCHLEFVEFETLFFLAFMERLDTQGAGLGRWLVIPHLGHFVE